MGFKSEILSYLFEEQYIHFEFDASKTFPKKKDMNLFTTVLHHLFF